MVNVVRLDNDGPSSHIDIDIYLWEGADGDAR